MSEHAPLIVGSRGSRLALWQAEYARANLKEAGVETSLEIIESRGDREQDRSLESLTGPGFFTGELEQALGEGRIDIAVHSFKDLPTEQPDGLAVAAVSYRADPADVLLIRPGFLDRSLPLDLKEGCRVGTSSARRKSQLQALRPDLEVLPIRGNVPTRVDKLRQGDYDAILLAAAGLERLELDLGDLIYSRLRPQTFVPAPGQAVLAYEVRKGDLRAIDALEKIHDPRVAMVVRAERKLLSNLHGGCSLPFGAFCREEEGICHFWVSHAEEPGRFPRRLWLTHPDPDVLVVEAWHKLSKAAPASVFISRELAPDSVFRRAMVDHGVALQAESLLHFEALAFNWPYEASWCFFSSRTAVREFGRRLPEGLSGLRFAAIGEGTARELRKLGLETQFVADPLQLEKSVDAFARLVGGSTVVFPQAENALRSVQQIAGSAIRTLDLPVYRNEAREEFEIAEPEIAVFTSPMNAMAYFERYPERAAKGRFIAIGSTTESALRDAGAWNIFRARRPGELALTEAVFSC